MGECCEIHVKEGERISRRGFHHEAGFVKEEKYPWRRGGTTGGPPAMSARESRVLGLILERALVMLLVYC